MNLFKKKQSDHTDSYEDLLDQTLYKIPGINSEITWADSVEGTLITGTNGSGKSSGPGRHIGLSMLKSGFGMCILCAKKDERRRWERYIQEKAPERQKDLVIFDKNSDLNFNFLKYEMERSGEGSGEILNAIYALMNLNEQNRIHMSGGGGNNEERFWDMAVQRLISRSINTLRLAGEEVSIWNMRRLVSNRLNEDDPIRFRQLINQINTTNEIDEQERQKAAKEWADWVDSNYLLQVLENLPDQVSDEIELILDYWLKDFPSLGEKTMSNVVESFSGMIEPFLSEGILKDQFSSGLSPELLPENIYLQRKIVIVDFPIKEYKLAGIYAATIYKTAFQDAMERRDIESEQDQKPVGLWIDEYQNFCNPKADSQFQLTARSSWVATVIITQNINNMFMVMGNQQPEAKAKSLLGNLNLKYFAANDCPVTNGWASQMIGQHLTDHQNLSISKNMEISKTKHQHMQFRITPDHFTFLKKGRRINKYIVEAVVFKAGKTIGKEGENFALAGFNQKA